MRKAITLLLLTLTFGLLTTGCGLSRAQRSYNACLRAGYNEGQCEMLKLEMERQYWQGVGESLQNIKLPTGPPQPPSLSCTTTYFGNMATTRCH